MSRPAGAVASRAIEIVLIGNPNVGKTTLFNALTGLRHRVGNYPGVTVETKTGVAQTDLGTLRITDVPGTYSLSPRSPDEMLAVDLMLGHRPEQPRPDCILCVVDASNLERNLYLATQVLELGVPVVLALNMIDIAESRGIVIDVAGLSQELGTPVVPVVASTGRGLAELRKTLFETATRGERPKARPRYPVAFDAEVNRLADWIQSVNGEAPEPFLMERMLLDAGGATERVFADRLGSELATQLAEARERLRSAGASVPAVEARVRYGWIGERTARHVRRPAVRAVTFSDRLDRILIHRVWGLVIFFAVMALVFQSLFSWAHWLMDPIQFGFGSIGEWLEGRLPSGPVRELLVHGLVAGVGNVVVFLPQIVMLFAFLAILEDCGYMARAAFLMDRVMAKSGLSGKSFIPLLSSFACAVPGILSTRTIEDSRDRLVTILVAPLMSCSARLPVYVLFTSAFVPRTRFFGFLSLQALVLFSMYMLGLLVAPVVAWLLKRTLLKGSTPIFLMELPGYKLPSLGTVLYRMADRGWAFLQRAGTIILATTIIVWALQYYPRSPSVTQAFAEEEKRVEELALRDGPDAPNVVAAHTRVEHRRNAAYQAHSILGRMGQGMEPAFRPLGWDWRIGMAVLASFPAREVVVSALGTIFSVGTEASEDSLELEDALRAARWPDGRPLFSLPVALSLMVFFALCCQCGATLAVIARETNSWRWPIFTFVYMTGLAYVAAFATYQIAVRLV